MRKSITIVKMSDDETSLDRKFERDWVDITHDIACRLQIMLRKRFMLIQIQGISDRALYAQYFETSFWSKQNLFA